MINIQNEMLTGSISPVGAELTSLIDKKSGKELIWQGNRAVWGGQAPVLFPIVGRLMSDSYSYNGVKYFLQRHGFARKSSFDIISDDDISASMRLCSNDETRRVYPFDFSFTVSYELEGSTLFATNTVINTGKDKMYFSLGAHPGFNTRLGYQIILEENETIDKEVADENGIIFDKRPFLSDERKIELTKNLFDTDALILPSPKSTSAVIADDAGKPCVKVGFGKVPYLLIWSKPGADFVCIEPWHGICDSYKSTGVLSEKKGIIPLAPLEKFVFEYSITVL